MVGPSKILTVSYGTFSCTLEGFDDPFSTMRGIAEYFRDLAADDRYFGAEPPTPDAEMLHQIAQREVKRRVEAQLEDNGITLRQVEQQPAPAAPPAVAPAAHFADDDAAENMFADIGIDESAPAGDADDEAEAAQAASVSAFGDAEPVDTVPEAFDDNSVAAKLSRIRAVVSRGAAAPASPTAFSGPIEKAFEGPAPEAESPVEAEAAAVEAPALAEEEAPAPEAETAEQAPAADIEEIAAGTPQPYTDAPDAQPESTTDEGEEPVAEAEYDEADPWAVSPEEILAGEEAPAETPEAPEEVAEDNSLAARIVRLKRAALGEEGTPDETAESAPQAAQAGLPAAEEDLADAEPADEELAAEAPSIEEPVEEDPLVASADDMPDAEDGEALFAEFDAEEDAADALEDDAPLAEPAEETAEEDNLDPGAGDILADAAAEPETTEPEPEPQVSEEAQSIAAMKAAIAEAASAVGAHTQDDQPEDEPAETVDEAEEARAADAFESREEPGDAAFDRILEQTNSRMDDSEGNRRRSAIAHLKAAVAATKADRLLKRIKQPEEQAAEDQSQYRDDLAKVVRPRRTETETREEKTERPEMIEEKASPLMLVSELRVDEDDADKADMIAPRRVNTETLDLEEGQADEGFVQFAKKMGATELPDLLEAAAAYSAFVEGRKEFSRPQLMRAVASVDQGEFTREAGLRSFGQLLRQGKIQKLKRGQFTITAETRFNPEARIAGE